MPEWAFKSKLYLHNISLCTWNQYSFHVISYQTENWSIWAASLFQIPSIMRNLKFLRFSFTHTHFLKYRVIRCYLSNLPSSEMKIEDIWKDMRRLWKHPLRTKRCWSGRSNELVELFSPRTLICIQVEINFRSNEYSASSQVNRRFSRWVVSKFQHPLTNLTLQWTII